MKLTLGKIANSVTSINKLNDTLLPAKISFRLTILSKNLDEVLKVYNDKLNNIFEKYGDKIDKEQIKIKQENIENYTKERNELDNEEIEIEIQDIKISEIENVNIAPNDIMILDWLIKE